MMNMLIQIDEARVESDKKYSLSKMRTTIDKQFERGCTKECQGNGEFLYCGDAKKDYYTCINLAVMTLSQQPWFLQYCIQWIWYDNDDDEELPFQELDILKRLK